MEDSGFLSVDGSAGFEELWSGRRSIAGLLCYLEVNVGLLAAMLSSLIRCGRFG